MMREGRAVGTDKEAALEAAEGGECLLCRIGARHTGSDRVCPKAPWWDFYWDCRQAFRDAGLVLVDLLTQAELERFFRKASGAPMVLSQFLNRHNALQVDPVRVTRVGMKRADVETCPEEKADFWRLYGFLKTGGAHSLADCRNKEEAVRIANRINLPLLLH